MDKLSRITRTLQPTLVGLGLLLLGLGAYFYRYLPAQRDAQDQRLFRHLDEMGIQLTAKLEILTNCVVNAASAALSHRALEAGVVPREARNAFRTGVAAFVPQLVSDPNAFDITSASPGGAPSGLRIRIGPAGPSRPLHCDFVLQANALEARGRVTADLGELIAPILARHEFDEVLLISTRREVLSPVGRGLLRLDRMPALHAMPRPDPTSVLTNTLALGELVAATRASCVVAGRPHVVFLQPLPLQSFTDEGAPSPWILAGILRAEELDRRTRPLPYYLIFGIAALVLLLAVLLPFLQLVLERGRGPIHNQQIVFLVAGALAGSGGLVVISAHLAQHWHQEAQLDRELAPLSARLQAAFRDETAALVHWLDGLTEARLRSSPLDAATNQLVVDFDPGQYNHAPAPSRLRMIHWVRSDGMQAVKWTPTREMTPRIRVDQREYFRSIVTGGAAQEFDPATFGLNRAFYLQPLHSRLRSENVLACSIAAPVRTLAGQEGLVVLCAEFLPASLVETRLPPGYHFAVVSQDGQVLFHSDARRNLRENLWVEAGEDPRLSSALEGRREDALSLDYYQRRHRAHIAPMAGTPWSLVTLREHRLLDSMRASQSAATATVLGAAGLALVLVLWLAAGLRRLVSVRPPGLPRWVWPNRAGLPVYRLFAAVGLVLLVAAFLLEFTQFPVSHHPWVLAASVLSGPASVAIAAIWLMARVRRLAEGAGTLSAPPEQRWYVVWLAVSLAVAVMPGALAVHRVIAELEADRFMRWNQATLAASATRELLQQPDPRTAAASGSTGDYRGVFQRTETAWVPGRNATADAAPSEARFRGWLHAIRQDFDDPENVGVRMHGWGGTRAHDGSWWSLSTGDQVRFFQQVRHPSGGTGALQVTSRRMTFPGWGGGDFWFLFGVLGIALGLGSAAVAAWFIASRVLLLRHGVPESTRSPGALVVLAAPSEPGRDSGACAELSDPVRHFIAHQSTRLRWRHGLPTPVDRPALRTLEVWDLRSRVELPEESVLRRWLRFAAAADCQVVILGATPEAVRSLAGLAGGEAALAGTWHLPAGDGAAGEIVRCLAADFQQRWAGCTAAERHVLRSVAQTGFEDAVHPALPGLLRNGLLRLDPKLRTPSAAWRRFLLDCASEDPVVASASDDRSSWPLIRGALVVAILAVMAFLMITQPDTWQRTTGVMAGLLAGLKLLGDFLGTLRKEAGGTDR